MQSSSDIEYCFSLLAAHDPDRLNLSLLMPKAARPALWTLFAFNYEIARTREVVTDTHIGLIRLQWWRDAITAVYDGGPVPAHQIVTPLRAAIETYDLPQDLFETLLYAREFDLEDVLPADLAGLRHYADFTNTPLARLACRIEGAAWAEDSGTSIAAAYGLTGLLRAVPAHADQRRCYLPDSLLSAAGLSADAIYDPRRWQERAGTDLAGFRRALAEAVHPVHAEAARLNAQPRTGSRFLTLMARHNALYLNTIEKCRFDVLDPRMTAPRPLKILRLWAGF